MPRRRLGAALRATVILTRMTATRTTATGTADLRPVSQARRAGPGSFAISVLAVAAGE